MAKDDEENPMEASEQGAQLRRIGRPPLHRIDPDRIRTILTQQRSAAGYARLEMMLGTVIPRLGGAASESERS